MTPAWYGTRLASAVVEFRPVGRACGQSVACRSGLKRAQVGYILLPSFRILALHLVHYFVGSPHVTLVLLAFRQPAQ